MRKLLLLAVALATLASPGCAHAQLFGGYRRLNEQFLASHESRLQSLETHARTSPAAAGSPMAAGQQQLQPIVIQQQPASPAVNLHYHFYSGSPAAAAPTAPAAPAAPAPSTPPIIILQGPGVPPSIASPGVPPSIAPPGVPPSIASPGVPPSISPPGVPPSVSPPGIPPSVAPPGVAPGVAPPPASVPPAVAPLAPTTPAPPSTSPITPPGVMPQIGTSGPVQYTWRAPVPMRPAAPTFQYAVYRPSR